MITIITAVYNRKETLKELFLSLLTQTSKEFEWLVIDDGSFIDLSELIKDFKNEADFNIVYRKVKHGGKHIALNVAIKLSSCDAFCIVDSDDRLLPGAIEDLNKWWQEIESDDKYMAAAGLMVDPSGTVSGGEICFDNYIDIVWTDRSKYGITGESVYLFRKKYWYDLPFPKFENEDFLSEATMMYKLAERSLIVRWHHNVIYQYEYLDDGLTKNINKKNKACPKGYAYLIACMKWKEWPDDKSYKERCKKYYEECYTMINNDEVMHILGLKIDEYLEIKHIIENNLDVIRGNLSIYNKCSLYGYGNWGHIMEYYLNICRCAVERIIDKNKIIFESDSVSGIYEDGGLLIVCIKSLSDLEKDEIEKRYNNFKIIYMNEIYRD